MRFCNIRYYQLSTQGQDTYQTSARALDNSGYHKPHKGQKSILLMNARDFLSF